MKYCHPYFETAIVTCEDKINTIVVENAAAFSELLGDIASSLEGNEVQSVLFDKGKKLSFSSNVELLSTFFPFELNKKTLLTKIAGALEKEALTAERYEESMKLVSATEAFLYSLAESFDCNLSFDKVGVSSIIKSSGLELVDDYASLPEKLLDYFETVREFDRDKLFFTVNLRGFLTDEQAEGFFQSVVMHQFSVIMLENKDYPKSKWEKRLILDKDLCTI